MAMDTRTQDKAPTSAPSGHETSGGDASWRTQLKRAVQGVDGFAAQSEALSPGGVHGVAQEGVSAGGGALPHLDTIQHSFGRHDVSGVSAHVGGRAADASRAIGAEAYATGDRVAFAQAPSLHTAAHEAAHVVQQRAGVSLLGGVGRSGDAYERHADDVADAVVQGRSAEALLDEKAGGGGGAGVQRVAVQRKAVRGGPELEAVQEKLNSLGYDAGAVDGIWGKRTRGAVKRFQGDQGIAADGIVGPMTLARLDAASGGGTPAGDNANDAAGDPKPETEPSDAEGAADEVAPAPVPDKGDASKTDEGGGKADEGGSKPAPPAPVPVPTPSQKDEPSIAESVGAGGANLPADVAWVTKKLAEHGIQAGSSEEELAAAIKAYEARALNRSKSAKSVVKPGDYIHHALLAGAAPAPIAVADPAALVASSDVPAVVALRTAVHETRVFRDGIKLDRGEEAGGRDGADADKRDELVTRIAGLRAQIESMNLAGVPAEEARAIRAWGFRQVNELSPYYSQGRNANILEGTSTRTCNLTSLAMTLEALGVTSANYTGDMTVIEQIRNASKSQGGSTKKELDAAWGKNEHKQGVDGLRMPDFLQLVAVAHEVEKGKTVMQGLTRAWNAILSPANLRTYATKFGVKAWLRHGAGTASGKSKAQQWQDTFGAELDAGRQVVMLIPGHFVRLQAVVEDGIIVDDPATGTKKNRPMAFSEVKSYQMVVLG